MRSPTITKLPLCSDVPKILRVTRDSVNGTGPADVYEKRTQARVTGLVTVWRNAFREKSYRSIPGCKQVKEDAQEVYMKSPWLAFLLSFLVAGAGFAYLGKWTWAISIIRCHRSRPGGLSLQPRLARHRFHRRRRSQRQSRHDGRQNHERKVHSTRIVAVESLKRPKPSTLSSPTLSLVPAALDYFCTWT